ncbi:MAG: hypothetical protein Q8880_00105 [Bacteroidota bacterium]|nr:hypothetical protein [Bacteroidota bacterium]
METNYKFCLFVVISFFLLNSSKGQNLLGFKAGYNYTLISDNSERKSYYTKLNYNTHPGFCLGINYINKPEKSKICFNASLNYTFRSFSYNYLNLGLADSYSDNSYLNFVYLSLNLGPEINTKIKSCYAFFNIGFSFNILVNSHKEGLIESGHPDNFNGNWIYKIDENYYSGNAYEIMGKTPLGYHIGAGFEFPFKESYKIRTELNYVRLIGTFEYGNIMDLNFTCGIYYTLGKKNKPQEEKPDTLNSINKK